jgi:hypothetical protein
VQEDRNSRGYSGGGLSRPVCAVATQPAPRREVQAVCGTCMWSKERCVCGERGGGYAMESLACHMTASDDNAGKVK